MFINYLKMSTNQTIIEYKNGIIKNPINNYPINSFKIIGQIFVEEINKLCYQFSQILELDLSDCDIIKRYKQPKNTIELLQNFGTGEYVNKVITEFPRINFSLIERIVLPESIISISNQAFSDLFSLKEIILPNNLKDIGDEAFKNCINLQKIIVPKNIETIKRDTFNNCISLYYIYLSPNVHNIEKYAFKNCKSLRIIEGCANLVNIEKNAFLKCDLISENELCVKLQKNIPKVDFLSMGIQGFSLGILVSKSKIWTPKYGEIYCDKLSNPYIAGSVVCIPIYRESIIYTGHGLNIFDKQIRNTTDEFYYVLELLNSKDNESHISFSLSSTLKLHNKASNYIYEFEKFESDLIKFLIEEPPILNKQQIDI